MRAVVPSPLVMCKAVIPRRLSSMGSCNVPAARRSARPRQAAVYHLGAVAAAEPHARASSAGAVSVTFTINRKVNFGQSIVILGDAEQLGAWELDRAPRMAWSEGDNWTATVELPAGATVEYKFALSDPHQAPEWETCDNRHFSVPAPTVVVTCAWDEPGATTCEPAAGAGSTDSDLPLEGDVAPAFRPAQVIASSGGVVGGGLVNGRGQPAAAAAVEGGYSAQQLEFLKRKLETIQSRPAAVREPVAAATSGHYSAEQLEFMRRSGKLSGSASPAPAQPARQATAAAASSLGHGSTQQYSPEQLAFLQRRGSEAPTPTTAPARSRSASPQPARAASPHTNGTAAAQQQRAPVRRSPSPVQRPSSRSPSPRPAAAQPAAVRGSPAPQATQAVSYSPEQLAFLQRSGKSPSPAPAPAAGAQHVGSTVNYSPEQLAFLKRSGKL